MGSLHNPAPGSIPGVAFLGARLLAALANMGKIVAFPHGFCGGFAGIALVRAKMFRLRWGTIQYDSIQSRLQKFHVMALRPAHDYRQRDSTGVHQQAALGPFFSPGPWGWVRPPPAPTAP